MLVHRITPTQYANDLSGEGARLFGGRWNSKGMALLYTAESAAMAMLEALAHMTMIAIKRPYSLVSIYCPNEWFDPNLGYITTWLPIDLPANWQYSPPPESLAVFGNQLVMQNAAIVMRVPSVLLPTQFNFLFNPRHPLFHLAKVEDIKPIAFDLRLVAGK